MDNPYNADAEERANIQGTRLAGAIARMHGTYQSGMFSTICALARTKP